MKLIAFQRDRGAFPAAGRVARISPDSLRGEFEGSHCPRVLTRALKGTHALRVHLRHGSRTADGLGLLLNLCFHGLEPVRPFHVPRPPPPIRSAGFRRLGLRCRHDHRSRRRSGADAFGPWPWHVITDFEIFFHVTITRATGYLQRKAQRDPPGLLFDLEVELEPSGSKDIPRNTPRSPTWRVMPVASVKSLTMVTRWSTRRWSMVMAMSDVRRDRKQPFCFAWSSRPIPFSDGRGHAFDTS